MLVSHDVVSLFTNTPIEKSLKVIKQRREKDHKWKDVFIGSRGHSGTTEIHPFYYIFHNQRSNLQTVVWYSDGKSRFSFGGQHVHGTLREFLLREHLFVLCHDWLWPVADFFPAGSLPEVSAQPVSRNIVCQHLPTVWIKPIIQSTGKRPLSSTENKTVLLGGSRKLHISANKVIELWIETSAAISWVTPTTAFLMQQVIIASRLGRTEYQLLLIFILW